MMRCSLKKGRKGPPLGACAVWACAVHKKFKINLNHNKPLSLLRATQRLSKLSHCHDEDSCKNCGMDKLGRYMAIIEGWTTLAATQCSVAKDGTFEETPLVDIIATIISPHNRPYTGLCFPQSWDPLRPLKLENNNRDKLDNYYGVPVTCECDYAIPMLKGLPKAKKDKSAENKNVKKSTTDKIKDADKNTKTKGQGSSSKNADSAESSNKISKPKKSHKNKKEENSDDRIDDKTEDTTDTNIDMAVSEGEGSANEQPHQPVDPVNTTTGDASVPDINKNKTPGDTSVTTTKTSKTPSDIPVTTAGTSSEDFDSDSDSVVELFIQPGEIEMSENQPDQVEFEAPLHSFSIEEDRMLLSACWETNLSPRWTSSVHIPLPNSKELLLLHWLCRGFESGFWHEGVPEDLWVPFVYKQLSISDVYELKKRIVGTLARAPVFKNPAKTHKFYEAKEKAHRAAQESKEKHVVNVSMDQLYTLIVSVTEERERQANNGGSMGLETALTPWVAHKLRSFVGDNLVHPVAGYQLNKTPYEGQKERRGSNASSSKGRGRNAPVSTRGGSNASTSGFDRHNDCVMGGTTAEPNGDSLEPTPGGSNPRGRGGSVGSVGNVRGRGGFNNKRERSSSSIRTGERVPAKRGGGVSRGGQGPQVREVPVENPKKPRDCKDKSKVWACPLEDCRRHVNYNWQQTCFGCKTYFCQDRGGNWVPSTKPPGQSDGHGSSRGTRRGDINRG